MNVPALKFAKMLGACLLGVVLAAPLAFSLESKPETAGAADAATQTAAAPITAGLRVFTCGHSFHAGYVTPILADIAAKAGIKGHEITGLSMIGGSRVIQHWNVPDEKNKVKPALREGKVDVLTLSPMHQPDEGIDKFAELAFKGNPDIRVTIQEFWIPWDKMEWPFKGKQEDVNPDAMTIGDLRALHDPYFKTFDKYIADLNTKLGKQVLFIVPVGQAVLALREKIIAGQAPGIEKQSELFTDKLGHPKAPLQALAAYCHFAVIYHRNPIGLPIPDVMARARNPNWDEKLNRLLQELAWDAVTHHPQSGVKVEPAANK